MLWAPVESLHSGRCQAGRRTHGCRFKGAEEKNAKGEAGAGLCETQGVGTAGAPIAGLHTQVQRATNMFAPHSSGNREKLRFAPPSYVQQASLPFWLSCSWNSIAIPVVQEPRRPVPSENIEVFYADARARRKGRGAVQAAS